MTDNTRKDRLKAFGVAFLEAAAQLSDGPLRVKIAELDTQIAELQKERDSLVSLLTYPDEEPKKVEETPIMNTFFGKPARFVQCEGRRHMGMYHKAHPGCPYLETVHNAHEFTLRD